MKLTLTTSHYRDRNLLVELFDIAVAIYKDATSEETLPARMKEQFTKQMREGSDLTMQLWHQRDRHEIAFTISPQDDPEGIRWLIINMMTTGIEELTAIADGTKKPLMKAQILQRIARAEQLREMVEDTRIK